MKKVLMIVLCLVLAVGLVACSNNAPTPSESPDTQAPETQAPAVEESPAQEEETPAGEKPLVGISVPQAPTGWVAAVQGAAEQTAERLNLNYKLLAAENEGDQANDIDDLIQMGCKIIVLFPHNDTLAPSAQKIMDAGITLINFDRTLGDVVPDYYVAGDNRQMGVLGAEYIGEKLGGKGKVVIAIIPAYGEIFTQRVNGFKDTIAEKFPDIEIVGPADGYAAQNGSPEEGLRIMTDALTANPVIDGIYSTDDELSIGLIKAIEEQGRMGEIKVITGGGGSQAYFKVMDQYPEMYISSQTYDPYMMITAVEIAAGLLEGKTYEARTIIPPKNLDRTNYQAWLDENNITPDAPY
ncbi:MAG: sugar ABC transporter substrate-binding protein [Christensenellaceae bacterium]|nr:sugar ABC transporter substrate-binding protein [Christensenellaceae bacterium]